MCGDVGEKWCTDQRYRYGLCSAVLGKFLSEKFSFWQEGETPLHFAAREGLIETVNLLLEDRANPTIQNINGENVLHVAVKESNYTIAKRIIEYTSENFSKKNACDLVNQANKVRIEAIVSLNFILCDSLERAPYITLQIWPNRTPTMPMRIVI